MKVRDKMTKQVVFVNPKSSIVEAAQLMQKHDVGSIPVCEGQNVIGIVTDRDIVVRNIAHGKDPHTSPVSDVMTSQVKTVDAEMSLDQAAELMGDGQIRRLPVVEAGRLVGMISLGDLATTGKYGLGVDQTLGEISTPSSPEQLM